MKIERSACSLVQREEIRHQVQQSVRLGDSVAAEVVQCANYSVREHQHEEAQVSILCQGVEVAFVTHSPVGRSKVVPLRPGAVSYIPPYQPHEARWTGSGLLLNLYFPQEYLARLAADMKCPVPLTMPTGRQESLINSIGHLVLDEVRETGDMLPGMVEHARFLVATRLLRLSDLRTRERASGLLSLQRLRPAIELLRSCPEQTVTMTQLSGLCKASVYYFARSFTAHLGCAPFTYQRKLRLEKAEQLLRDTELSVETIAGIVGVESPATFSRMFRRHAGYSPREYKRIHRKRFAN